MAVKGMERREVTPAHLEQMINVLQKSDNPNLANVLITHRMVVDRDGYVELGRKLWREIEHHIDIVDTRDDAPNDLTLGEAVDFLADAGMQVVVIDEDGVHDGILHDDDSIEVNRKMDILLDSRTEFSEDGKTAFIPQEVLDELDPDAELEAPLFPTCGCGCGGRTKGGRYIPGHDARHKGILMRRLFLALSDGGLDEEAAEAAELELQLRGWYKFYPAFAKNEAKRVRRANVARCDVCGRPLFDEESVERGIGPVCAGKH